MRFKSICLLLIFLFPMMSFAEQKKSTPLDILKKINAKLAARHLQIRAEQIEFFTIGNGRPSSRIHQQEFRWVPGDPRRDAQGDDITYIVDLSGGNSTSGVTSAQFEDAVDAVYKTWQSDRCLKKVKLVKRADPGTDITILDGLLGFGGIGNPSAGDIVDAGFVPQTFFDAAACGVPNSGCGCGIIAFSITFIFTDDQGNPTDINGDNRLDTALNEVYFDDVFGGNSTACGGAFNGNPWGIDVPLPGIDVQTVALHENGHSLGLGHFGPPPACVMNPVYAGIRHSPFPIDSAGMCTIWSSWPNP